MRKALLCLSDKRANKSPPGGVNLEVTSLGLLPRRAAAGWERSESVVLSVLSPAAARAADTSARVPQARLTRQHCARRSPPPPSTGQSIMSAPQECSRRPELLPGCLHSWAFATSPGRGASSSRFLGAAGHRCPGCLSRAAGCRSQSPPRHPKGQLGERPHKSCLMGAS